MKIFNKSVWMGAALLMVVGFTACEDANEFEDTYTDNPAFVSDVHPDSLAGQMWVRGQGIKFNAYGEEVQGYVESLDFVTKDSVVVTMSQGVTAGTMGADHSCTYDNPYEYEYVEDTGDLKILQLVTDDKGKVSKVTIFTGVAVSGTKYGDILTVVHYGDTPAQTYLVRK